MELISRKEATAQGLRHYYTGKPCLRGHVSERLVSTGHCCACKMERQQTPETKAKAAAYAKTPERRAKAAAYAKKPVRKAAMAAYAKKPEAKAQKAAYKQTPEAKAKQAAWAAANPSSIAAIAAQRRAAKLQRTPKWLTPADKAAIKAIYEQCAFTSRVTGQAHHVDHFYPLQGEFVSGLHCPLNLRIITATENLTKSNKLLEQFA